MAGFFRLSESKQRGNLCGCTDCEEEIEALVDLINTCGVSFIQLRNLNIDPELYMKLMEGVTFGPSVGLVNFRKRLRSSS